MPHPASARVAVAPVELARERLPEEALGLPLQKAVYVAPERETLVVRVDHMPVLEEDRGRWDLVRVHRRS